MQVKVCGLTQAKNVESITELGVDYVGFIFYGKSKRLAKDAALKKWIVANPGCFTATKKVGVFVNAEVDQILNAVHDYQLDLVQLHGDESAGYCQELQLLWSVNTLRSAKIIKAFRIDENFDFATTTPYASASELFVFDTGGQADHGGTGVKWDWKRLADYTGSTPFLLSGGIGPGDAAALSGLRHPQFAGVDLNSRFETSPGVKDVELLTAFLAELNAVE